MDLNKRREDIITEHKAQEKYDPYWKAEAEKGRKISERPVAFQCDDEVVLVGECVPKVMTALSQFVIAHGDAYKSLDTAPPEHHKRYGVAKAVSLLGRHGEEGPHELRVPQQAWNGLLFCLETMGVDVVLADGTHAPKE